MLFCCVFVSCNRAIKLHVHDVVLAFGSINLLTYRGGTALCSRIPTECSTTVQKAPFGKLSASLMSSFLSHLRSSEFQLFGRQYTCKYQMMTSSITWNPQSTASSSGQPTHGKTTSKPTRAVWTTLNASLQVPRVAQPKLERRQPGSGCRVSESEPLTPMPNVVTHGSRFCFRSADKVGPTEVYFLQPVQSYAPARRVTHVVRARPLRAFTGRRPA